MTPLYLAPTLFLLEPPTPLKFGVDYDWDAGDNTVRRIEGGAIPSGERVMALQAVEVASALLASLESGAATPLPLGTLQVLAIPDWDAAEPSPLDWSDLAWECMVESSLVSEPRRAHLTGPPALREAWESLAEPGDTLIQINQVIAEEFVLPLFEGFVEALDVRAAADGCLTIVLELADALRRLEPPHCELEQRRFGRSIDRTRQVVSTQESPGFLVQSVCETIAAIRIPTAHQVLRAVFAALDDPFFTELVLGILDFPVPEFDARDLTPLEIFQEIARLAGGQLRAEGRLLVVREFGPASRSERATFIYPESAIHQLERTTQPADILTALQLFGHTENGAIPTRPAFPVPQDPSQPGFIRLGETQGTMDPPEPTRTDQYPDDLQITFTFNGTLYDPASLIVDGARRVGPPRYQSEGGVLWATVDLALPWVVVDRSGDAPFTLNENGEPRFLIVGQVVDALASTAGEPVGIPYAIVSRERLAGGEPTGDRIETIADTEGFYRFTDVPLGVYRILASAVGFLDNWSDTDPDNNLIRDLESEYADWLDNEALGRYEIHPTPYHVIVWAKPRIAAGDIQDLTLGQVRVEVRAEGVNEEDLHYAPAMRDERLTTERLAARVGQIVLWSSRQTAAATHLQTPPNPLLLPGDRIVVRDAASDTIFDCAQVRHRIDALAGTATDDLHSLDPQTARQVLPRILEDPLGTRIGSIVGIGRNQFGQEVVDVDIEGDTQFGLGVNPVVGPLAVSETVQVAKWHPGALHWLVVARAPAQPGTWRIVDVPVE